MSKQSTPFQTFRLVGSLLAALLVIVLASAAPASAAYRPNAIQSIQFIGDTPLHQEGRAKIDADFDILSPQPGDTFGMQLPPEFSQSGVTFDVPETDDEGNEILDPDTGEPINLANCAVSSDVPAIVTCTLTDEVAGRSSVDGQLWFEVYVRESTEEETVTFTVDGEEIVVDLPGVGGISTNEPWELPTETDKTGFKGTDGSLRWGVELPGRVLLDYFGHTDVESATVTFTVSDTLWGPDEGYADHVALNLGTEEAPEYPIILLMRDAETAAAGTWPELARDTDAWSADLRSFNATFTQEISADTLYILAYRTIDASGTNTVGSYYGNSVEVAGQTLTDVFQYRATGGGSGSGDLIRVSIGDYTWFDNNRNGQQDDGEPPVTGMTVNLIDGSGNPVGSTVTDDDGYYYFVGLMPDSAYIVEFVKPDGTTFTSVDTGDDAGDSDADPATGRVSVVTPETGENERGPDLADIPTIDAGLVQYNLVLTKELTSAATVSAGDEVTFELTPSNEGPADALAGWSVTEVPPTELTITAMAGDGYECDVDTLTCSNAAVLAAGEAGAPITVTATVNTDLTGPIKNVAYVAPATTDVAETNPLEVPTNTTDTTATDTDNDAEAVVSPTPLVSLGDYVWIDTNRDGAQSEGESPVAGVTVNLIDASGATVATTITGEDGYYEFLNLPVSTEYTVEFIKPADYSFTTQNAGTDDAADSDADPATGRVVITTPAEGENGSGPDNTDDPTIDAGLVQYNLVLAKELTSAATVAEGDTVTFVLTPKNMGPADALAGWSVTEVPPTELTITAMTGDGYECDVDTLTCTNDAVLAADEAGAPITVTATVNTDLTGPIKNVAYVAPATTDEVPETNPLEVPTNTTDTTATDTDNDAEAVVSPTPLVSLGDYVWIDTNRDGAQSEGESPVAGVTVNLIDASGATVATTITGEDGYYEFLNLPVSTEYTVEFIKHADYSFTTQNAGTDDAADSDADPATGRVVVTTPASGENGSGPDNTDDPTIDAGLVQYNLVLTKELTSAATVAEGDEVTFVLTPKNMGPANALAGWSVIEVPPTELTITAMAGEGYECDVDTLTCTNAAVLAADEAGAPITVTATVNTELTGPIKNVAYVAPVSTDEVPETNPLEVPTNETDTTTSTTDNDAEASVSPTPVEPVVSIGDYVWVDTNRDGAQSEGENPVAGVTVNLIDTNGEKVATTTTDEDGYYCFSDLPVSTEYTVEFVPGEGYTFTTQNSGDDDAADSDADPATGRVDVTTPAEGENACGPNKTDDPTIDAGLVQYNLVLTKELTSSESVAEGDEVTFTLVPSNEGPANALAGWSVVEMPQEGLTITTMTGEGYDCDVDTLTCTNNTVLAAGASGGAITVTATVEEGATGDLHNVAYVAPATNDTTETNPLEIPEGPTTNTTNTPTDNDDSTKITITPAVVVVTPTPTPTPSVTPTEEPTTEAPTTPAPSQPSLPNTGANGMLWIAVSGGLLLLLGGALFLAVRRREDSHQA